MWLLNIIRGNARTKFPLVIVCGVFWPISKLMSILTDEPGVSDQRQELNANKPYHRVSLHSPVVSLFIQYPLLIEFYFYF